MKEKSKIIAFRAKVGFGGYVTLFVILSVFTTVLTVEFCFLFGLDFSLWWICLVIPMGLLVICLWIYLTYLKIKKVHKYNEERPYYYITYKNKEITVWFDFDNTLKIPIENIYDLSLNKSVEGVVTPDFCSVTTYEHGDFFIYYEIDEECRKLKLENVANLDQVLYNMYDILGWNELDELDDEEIGEELEEEDFLEDIEES